MTLSEFRKDRLKMSQEAFAEFLGYSQDQISRYENTDPAELPAKFFNTLAEKTGDSSTEIMKILGAVQNENKKPEPIKVDYEATWKKVDNTKTKLLKFVENKKQNSFKIYSKAEELEKECKNIVENTLRKKRVAVVGKFSAGKTSLINSLIGTENLPTSWVPTTQTATFIRHTDDKPEYLGENENVVIFKANENVEFNSAIVYENKKPESRKILEIGNYSILDRYGKRNEQSEVDTEIAAIAVYFDSEILKNVDFVDLPGYGTEEKSDDTFTKTASSQMDVLIYLSQATRFLDGDEIAYLRNTIRTLPVLENSGKNSMKPLGNLFIISSLSDIAKEENILLNGAIRLEKQIPQGIESYFAERSKTSGYKIDGEVFKSRFFTYSTMKKNLREKFENDFKMFLENLSLPALEGSEKTLRQFADSSCKKIAADIEHFKNLQKELLKEEMEYNEAVKNEPERQKKVHKSEEKVLRDISMYSKDSMDDFDTEFHKIIDEEHIVEVIKEKGYKKKKDDISLLSDYLQAELEDKLNGTLTGYSSRFEENINKYLSEFESVSLGNIGSLKLMAGFDARRGFMSGLAGLTTFGALGLWASAMGNLGGYILVAKGVSLLSMLGISISGGTAAAISAISTIGGPITIGIGLAIIAALSFFAIFSGGWQKQLAKKIVETYSKDNFGENNNQTALELYHDVIKKFWQKTQEAFVKGSKALQLEWKNKLAELKSNIEKAKTDPDYDAKATEAANGVKDFLSEIPNIVFN